VASSGSPARQQVQLLLDLEVTCHSKRPSDSTTLVARHTMTVTQGRADAVLDMPNGSCVETWWNDADERVEVPRMCV
jgi:hypothetical protein